MPADSLDLARSAYDELARDYDDLTQHHDYDAWVGGLLLQLRRSGFTGHRVLDVACGTGKSTEALRAAGLDVDACDASGAMLEAGRRAGRLRGAFVADMRNLESCAAYDLVCCLDDAVNYMRTPADLLRACRSFAGVVKPGGFVCFDCNTLRTYRTFFASTEVLECQRLLVWHGESSPGLRAGELARATVHIVEATGASALRRRISVHEERHHPVAEVQHALRLAGLRPLTAAGHDQDVVFSEPFDELLHTKVVHIARKSLSPLNERREVDAEHRDHRGADRLGHVHREGRLSPAAGCVAHAVLHSRHDREPRT